MFSWLRVGYANRRHDRRHREGRPGGNVKKNEVVKAVIVRARKETRHPDGSTFVFDENAAVIINNGEAAWHAYLRPRGPQAARQETPSYRLPRSGGDLIHGGKIRK